MIAARIFLTVALLGLIWSEAGFWTALAFFLIAVWGEITCWRLERLEKL